jgi:Kef-type K+ transport system membrane component KefB
MISEALIYISLIISVSAVLAILARVIKQPPIIAYLIAGVLVGPLFLNWIGLGGSSEFIQAFARIGVAFLLFIVGLSLDFRLFKDIGKVSTIAGLVEIIGVGIIGFFISAWMGFSSITSVYIGAAIAFSSTVVVVKILSDKREMDSLHGKIALGILIIQDIVASIFLMAIPIIGGDNNFEVLLKELGIACIVIAIVFFISALFFKRFLNYLARSQEALFLFGIAWALVLATLFYKLGFSMEIGALIAGMSLASSKYALDLSGKMKPLRDFFIVLFFVFFGSQLTGPITGTIVRDALILSAAVMILKPLVVMITLKWLGYTKRTNFLTSLSLAQISEFSLILMLLGFTLGHIPKEVMDIAVLVSLITIGISAYTINASHYILSKLSRFLKMFEGKIGESEANKAKTYDILLFGYHRIGRKLIETIYKMGKTYAIVDYDPKTIVMLAGKKIDCFYGDAENRDFLNELNLEKTKLIISTIPDLNSNLAIAEELKSVNPDCIFIATADHQSESLMLYDAGADYVILPHSLGGGYAAQMIKSFGVNKEKYRRMGKEHKKNIQKNRESELFS